MRRFVEVHLAPGRMSYDAVRERLAQIGEMAVLSEMEEREREVLSEYVEEYERDWEALGEDGREALMLWRLLDGQRVVYGGGGVSVPGDIGFPAIGFLFDLYGVDGERRIEVFERILAVDGVVAEMRRKMGKG